MKLGPIITCEFCGGYALISEIRDFGCGKELEYHCDSCDKNLVYEAFRMPERRKVAFVRRVYSSRGGHACKIEKV